MRFRRAGHVVTRPLYFRVRHHKLDARAIEDLLSLTARPALLNGAPCTSDLRGFAAELLAWSQRSDLTSFRRASASEELVYPLAAAEAGPAVYLVSDGVTP